MEAQQKEQDHLAAPGGDVPSALTDSTPLFTPEPWRWSTSNSWRRLSSVAAGRDGDVIYPTQQQDGHPDVCFPNRGFDGPDARLIAAAPALYEACLAMLRWDEAENAAKPFDDDNAAGFYARIAMCREAFDKARSALSLARGEQQ